MRADRHTEKDRHTGTLIAILRTPPPGGQSNCRRELHCRICGRRGRLLFEFPTSGGVLTSADLLTVTDRNLDELDVVVPQIIIVSFAVYFLLDLFVAVRRSVPPSIIDYRLSIINHWSLIIDHRSLLVDHSSTKSENSPLSKLNTGSCPAGSIGLLLVESAWAAFRGSLLCSISDYYLCLYTADVLRAVAFAEASLLLATSTQFVQLYS